MTNKFISIDTSWSKESSDLVAENIQRLTNNVVASDIKSFISNSSPAFDYFTMWNILRPLHE
jgi:hypothetical protein